MTPTPCNVLTILRHTPEKQMLRYFVDVAVGAIYPVCANRLQNLENRLQIQFLQKLKRLGAESDCKAFYEVMLQRLEFVRGTVRFERTKK